MIRLRDSEPVALGHCPLSNRGNDAQARKVNFTPEPEQIGVHLDRLAVQGWTKTVLTGLPGAVEGFNSVGEVKRRRLGVREVGERRAWMLPRGAEGGVYVRLRERGLMSGDCEAYIEWNPAKLGSEGEGRLRRVWDRLGLAIDRVCVRRWDAAIDYPLPRESLVLRAPGFKLTRHGIGPGGCESESAGGESVGRRFQIYDKVKERRAHGETLSGPLTRFEVQVWPKVDELDLADLGDVRLPEGGRPGWLQLNVEDVIRRGDPLFGTLAEVAMLGSVSRAVALAKCVPGWTRAKVEQFTDCMCGEVWPEPERVFRGRWRAEVVGAMVPLIAGRAA